MSSATSTLPLGVTPDVFANYTPTPSSLLRPSSSQSMSIRENVHVMIRCRPSTGDEEGCWVVGPKEGAIELSGSTRHVFQFDSVLTGVDNSEIYNAGIRSLVRSTMAGYSGTVFAYGQTASGKTYTMMGKKTQPGVIPRAVDDVFNYIKEDTHGREYLLRVSYLEIYKEQIHDLLSEGENSHPKVHEDAKRGIYVKGLNETIVTTAEQVMQILKKGEGSRKVSATEYNKRSSRSHTMFQLVIESKSKDLYPGSQGAVRVSQLNLIDLAGSEKVTNDSERQKEGAYINKSLLTLGTVISKLTSGQTATHIPFRNSKLTRILQPALSGNARICVICTVNPSVSSKEESLNTLRFAERAKLVKTSAKMTRTMDHSELQNCLKKIAELQTKMQEKTDQEAETRERLNHLLGLILTGAGRPSTKLKNHSSIPTTSVSEMTVAVEDETLVQSPDQIYPEYLTERTTMQDVVARLEEGLSVQMLMHQEQMKLMEKKTLGYKNALYTSQQIEHQRSEQLSQCQKKIEYQDERIKDFQQQIQALKQEKNPTNDFLLADQKEKKAKLEADLKEAIQLRNDVHCTCDHCAAIHNHSENPHTSSSETQELFLKQNTMDLLLSEKDQEIEELTTAAVIAHQKAERNNHLHQTIQEKNIHKIQSLEQALEKAMDSDKVYLTMDRMEEILESEYKTTVLEADLNLFKEYVVDCQENMNEMQKKMDKIQMELEEAHALKASCEKEAKEKHQHILMLEATLENAHSNTAMQLSELARKENRVVEVELLLLDVQQQQEAHIAALKEKDDRISQLETLMLNKSLIDTRASMAHQIELNDMDRQILDLRVIITEEQSLSTAQQKKLEQTKDRIVELETQLADKTVFTKTQQDSKSTERRIAELEAELANVYPLGVPPPPAYSDKARIYEKPLPVKEFEDSKIISQLNIENKKIMRVCRFLQIKVVRKKEMIARLQERLEEEKKTARRNKHRLARADASNTLMEFSLKEASRVHEERRVAVKAHTLFIHELQKTFVKLNGTIPVELREMRQHLPLFPVGNEDDSEDLLSQKMQEDTFWSSWSSIETAHAPPPTSGSFFSFASALKVASICGYVIVVTFLGGSIVYGHLSY